MEIGDRIGRGIFRQAVPRPTFSYLLLKYRNNASPASQNISKGADSLPLTQAESQPAPKHWPDSLASPKENAR